MMRYILKLFIGLLIALIITPFSSAYNSDELITLYIDDPHTWTSIYTVPEGKDLVLNRILASADNTEFSLRNATGATLWKVTGKTEYEGWELVIKDELQVLESNQNPSTWHYFMVFWFLVSEDEDIAPYLDGGVTAWNKHIFDKEDIDFIYFREFIIFSFAILFKFFSIIANRNLNLF